MRIINNILKLSLLFLILNCAPNATVYYKGDAPVSVYGNTDFGNIKVNESGTYNEFIVETDYCDEQTSMSNGYIPFSYKPVKISISVSDTVNFTLDTSRTKKNLDEGETTKFFIAFNPKSVSALTAVLYVKIYNEDGDLIETQTFNLSGSGV